MESCPTKTVLAGGMGIVLGGAFGLFMSSVHITSLVKLAIFPTG